MRKLIVLGNGFDVSHGLRTQYKDFLFNYLVKCLMNSVKNRSIEKNKNPSYEHKDLLIHLKFNFIELGYSSLDYDLTNDKIYQFIEKFNDFEKLMSVLINKNIVLTPIKQE